MIVTTQSVDFHQLMDRFRGFQGHVEQLDPDRHPINPRPEAGRASPADYTLVASALLISLALMVWALAG